MLRIVSITCLLSVTACSNLTGSAASCAGADAAAVTLDIVRDVIIKQASETDSEAPALSKSKIRASVQQLGLSLVDVRTTKDDPNSTKQFCTGRIKLVAPAEMLTDANEARQMAGLVSVEEMADNANVEAQANSFFADVDFNVQPTDDGEKIYAQLENGDEAIAFFAELVQAHLLKSSVADAKAEQDRIAAEQRAAEQSQQALDLEEAQAENKLAIETINAVWREIPADVRSRLLDSQRAWQKRKDAACRLEAASSATTEHDMSIARLRCDTREQQSRSQALRQYVIQMINEDVESM